MTPKEKFHQAMLDTYKISVEECNYRPKAFLGMVVELGGVETAKRLLATNVIQSGLYELFECGRLDLTVENIVLKDEFRELFTPAELTEAKRRIDLLKSSGRQVARLN